MDGDGLERLSPVLTLRALQKEGEPCHVPLCSHAVWAGAHAKAPVSSCRGEASWGDTVSY